MTLAWSLRLSPIMLPDLGSAAGGFWRTNEETDKSAGFKHWILSLRTCSIVWLGFRAVELMDSSAVERKGTPSPSFGQGILCW